MERSVSMPAQNFTQAEQYKRVMQSTFTQMHWTDFTMSHLCVLRYTGTVQTLVTISVSASLAHRLAYTYSVC